MWKPLLFMVSILATPLSAQDRAFTLQAPASLQDTGLLKHLLPRFSLKNGIRISLADTVGDARLGPDGTPVFSQGETIWHLAHSDNPHVLIFQDWLLSDVGKRTIEAFAPDGRSLFSAEFATQAETRQQRVTGDTAKGERLALSNCGRCHVVNDTNRMKAIGSTPSFYLLRSFDDWQERFEAFYVLKPHGAFTQIEGVTPPFEDHLPPPIAPLEITLEDVEAIVAFVYSLPPADLGGMVSAGSAFQSP